MPLSEDYLKSVPESELRERAYAPYELENYERESLAEVKRALKEGSYKKKAIVQESMLYLENLANKMNVIINNERKENKTTWELETDLADVKKLFDQLNTLLLSLEQKEADKKRKK